MLFSFQFFFYDFSAKHMQLITYFYIHIYQEVLRKVTNKAKLCAEFHFFHFVQPYVCKT